MIGFPTQTANRTDATAKSHLADSPGRESHCSFFALRLPAPPAPETGYVAAEGSPRFVVGSAVAAPGTHPECRVGRRGGLLDGRPLLRTLSAALSHADRSTHHPRGDVS